MHRRAANSAEFATSPRTQHLYSYVGNNPVNMVDPTGHYADTLMLAGEDQATRRIVFSKTIKVSVHIIRDDNVSEFFESEILKGINDWNQDDLYDASSGTHYNLNVITTEEPDSAQAGLIVRLHKNGRCCDCIKKDNTAHAYYDNIGNYYLDANGIAHQLTSDEIHLFSDAHYDTDYPEGLSQIVRHEFGHILGLNDAYDDFYHYKAENAASGSVMDVAPMNITVYDLGIIFGRNPNYERRLK